MRIYTTPEYLFLTLDETDVIATSGLTDGGKTELGGGDQGDRSDWG